MATKNLGRLEKIDLREAWSSESSDFTPWLARAENLKLLGDTIGIDLEFESQEKDVGPFRADILCKDTTRDEWVLIENQLERTNHNHLGQILTYAAGLNAVTIVWIAHIFTEEHRAALDWLNEHTDEKINFFGLEIELWRIADSLIAPKFNIISKPNDWTRTVQQAARGELTEHRKMQLQYWTAFKEFMEKSNSNIRCQKPYPENWMTHAIGRSGFAFASLISSWRFGTNEYTPEIRVELNISGKNSKEYYAEIEKKRDDIEKRIGKSLFWYCQEGVNLCRIGVQKEANFHDPTQWPNQHTWMKEQLEIFHELFLPIIKSIA